MSSARPGGRREPLELDIVSHKKEEIKPYLPFHTPV